MTLLLVQDDIDHILAEQPQKIQKQFTQCNLFPDLIAYVLSRIPNLYSVFASETVPEIKSHLLHESAERQLERENLIRQGIYLVLEKNLHKSIKSTPQNDSNETPSTPHPSSEKNSSAKNGEDSHHTPPRKSQNQIKPKSGLSQSIRPY
ncbi:hypothetical protein PN462_09050 [Spirulina sp. CS-785/01]|uniref:hypothetical protein n=1 Tax=Spirulina sp. CS-785/01 TaxID=3021716 RepID=UPI00232C6A35|nr:hypothetical protein [Spirulina sp. CS-785/01]MDB9313244.1 hypothetical protein [Spirulina sp. CS-785/01]